MNTFPGRVAAPLFCAPRRWRNFTGYVVFIAEHFNDEPRYAEPLAAWAAGGLPLDSRAAREALVYQEKCFRQRMRVERAARKAKADAEREWEKIVERAEHARLHPKSETAIANALRTDVLSFGRAWRERRGA